MLIALTLNLLTHLSTSTYFISLIQRKSRQFCTALTAILFTPTTGLLPCTDTHCTYGACDLTSQPHKGCLQADTQAVSK